MRVLVTGAGGFVGRALLPVLLEQGCQIAAPVRRGSGGLPKRVAAVTVPDLGGPLDWERLLKGVDGVVHLMARVHVLREDHPRPLSEFRRLNRDVTLKLARAAVRAGAKRFVFLSTIGVHGLNSGEQPLNEDSPLRPHSPYAVSKLEAEEALLALGRESGLEVVVLRPPLIYGPGVKGNLLRLLTWIWERRPLPLGGVRNRRHFLAAGNLAGLIAECLAQPVAAGQVLLAADRVDMSTLDLMRNLARGMGVRPRLFTLPPGLLRAGLGLMGKGRLYAQLCGDLRIDTRRARRLLHWEPPISPKVGQGETGSWFAATRGQEP